MPKTRRLRSFLTSISQATLNKERERETRAVYLCVDIAKTRGVPCTVQYIRRYRSQNVVRTTSNTRRVGTANYFRRNHAGKRQLLFTVNRYCVPQTTTIYMSRMFLRIITVRTRARMHWILSEKMHKRNINNDNSNNRIRQISNLKRKVLTE